MFLIDVFISSKIEGLRDERKALKDELDKLDIIQDVYLFEDYGASSTNLEDSYLEYVKKCDLYILIVRNSDEESEPTYKEFLLAKQMNKHMLIFFIKDCDKKSLIQRKLNEMDIDKTVKYEEIKDIKHLISKVMDSIYKDVAREYKKSYVNEDYNLGIAKNYITICDNSVLSKFLPKSFESGSIQSISFNLNDLFNTIEISQGKDLLNQSMDIFISNIFYESKFDANNFDVMSDEILKLHNDEQKKVVEKRLNAIKYYYCGLYKDANKSMRDALSTTNKNDWLYNNISVDIRNFDKNDRFGIEGQKLLDNSNNPTYFPLLDRYFANIERELSSFFKKESFNKVNEKGFVNYNNILVEISKAIKLSIFYGSLTYLMISIEKFYELCEFLYLKDKNPLIAALVYKGYILNRKKKNLEIFSIKCASLDFVYTDISLNKLLDLISNINDVKSQMESKMLVVKFFGYSLQKDKFDFLINEILNDNNKGYYYFGTIDFVLKCEIIKSIYLRLSNKVIIDFIIRNLISVNEINVFNHIFDIIKYKQLNNDEKEQLFLFFNSKIDEKWNNLIFTRIIFLFIEATDYKRDVLLSKLSKIAAEGVNDFNAFISNNETEINLDVKKCITSLEQRFSSYKSGIISYGNDNLIVRIIYHISNNYNFFADNDVSSLISICNEIVLSNIDSFSFKIKAIQILLYLKKHFDRFSFKICKFNINIINTCYYDLFEEYDYNSSKFIIILSNYFLLDRILEIDDLLPIFINSNEKEQYQILNFITESNVLFLKIENFIQFINMICKISYLSNNYHIKFLTLKLMINVLKHSKNQVLSELLLDGFIYGDFRTKHLIASNLLEYKRDINIESLEDKIKLDKSDLIRSFIKR